MANRKRQTRGSHNQHPGKRDAKDLLKNDLRIVGGTFRGRKLRYEPFQVKDDPVTRPMKHRVREAIFNLIGMEVRGCHAFDLFAGTGALGLEAISRGAVGATFIEKHIPTARVVETNITNLEVQTIAQLRTTSAFLWARRDLANTDCGLRIVEGEQTSKPIPWLVFCSPPYAFYVDRRDEMLELIAAVADRAPNGSLIVVEADERFDFSLLPGGPVGDKRTDRWQVRVYPPAVVGVWRKVDAHRTEP